MAKTNQNSIFYFRGKIDFENLLVLEKKQLENLPLEQNIFVLKKLSVNLGGVTIIGRDWKFSTF